MIDSIDASDELPPADWMRAERTTNGSGRLAGWLVALLGMVVGLAAFLPWGTVEGWGDPVTFTGMSVGEASDHSAGPGALTLCAGAVASLLGFVRAAGAAPWTTGVLNALAGAFIALVAFMIATQPPLTVLGVPLPAGLWEVEVGLWMTLLAGIGIVTLAIVGIVKRR